MTTIAAHTPYLLGRAIRRGGTCTFDGACLAGKSTLIFQYLKTLQDAPLEGAEFFGLAVPGGVRAAYICGDKPTEVTYEYAAECGLDLTTLRTWFLDSPHPSIASNERAEDPLGALMAIMQTFVDTDPALDLIVIEGFGGWLGVDVNSYTKTIPKLQQVIDWNNAHRRVALVGLGHLSKARNDFSMKRAIDRHNGSGSTLAYALGNMVLETPQEVDSHYYKWTLTPRNGAEQVIWLDHRTEGMGFQPVNPDHVEAPPSRGQEAKQALLDALRGVPGGMLRGAIIRYAVQTRHVRAGTARHAMDALVEAGTLIKDGALYRLAPGA